MKNCVGGFLLTAVILVLSTVNSTAQNSASELKVITYNIWNGFDWGKDEERRNNLVAWMKSQDPDVVALQELCGYTDEKLQQDAAQWGHPYSVILKTTGYPVGLTSNKPIELKERILGTLQHGALHVVTHDIDFMVVHLHPGSYARRREEAPVILGKMEEIRSSNARYIVLGDFNAQSPFDADLYDQDGPFLNQLREGNKDRPDSGNLFNGDLDFAVMASFIGFPLLDVCLPFTRGMTERGSFPGRVLGPVNNESMDQLVSRLQRIDYIMVSPDLEMRCIAAKVCNGEENWYLSDHYPVMAEFDLKADD